MCVFTVIWILRRFSRSPEPGICWHTTLLKAYVIGRPMNELAHESFRRDAHLFSEPYINVICPSVRLMSVFVVERLDPVMSIGAF